MKKNTCLNLLKLSVLPLAFSFSNNVMAVEEDWIHPVEKFGYGVVANTRSASQMCKELNPIYTQAKILYDRSATGSFAQYGGSSWSLSFPGTKVVIDVLHCSEYVPPVYQTFTGYDVRFNKSGVSYYVGGGAWDAFCQAKGFDYASTFDFGPIIEGAYWADYDWVDLTLKYYTPQHTMTEGYIKSITCVR